MGFSSKARVTKSRSIARVVAPPAPQIFSPSASATLTLTGQTPQDFLAAWRPSAPATLTLTGQTPNWSAVAALPTIVRYYSARLSAGFANNDPVDSLPELIAGTYPATKIGGLDANRPTFKTNVVNGQPALFWSGATSAMGLQAGSWTAITQPFTIFCICQANTWAEDANRPFGGLDLAHRTEIYRTLADIVGYAGSALNITTFAAAGTAWHVFIFTYNGASSEGWMDNTSGGAGNAGAQTSTGLTLGNLGGATSKTWDGYIAEWGLLTGASDASTRAVINNYAHTIYGITIA